MKNEECRMKNESNSSNEHGDIHSSFGSEATILHSSFKRSDHSSFKRSDHSSFKRSDHSSFFILHSSFNLGFSACGIARADKVDEKNAQAFRD